MFYDHWEYMHRFGPGFGFGMGPLAGLVIAILVVLPFWQIFTKAGYSGWWSLLMVLPGVNAVALYVLAFSDWPSQGRRNGGPSDFPKVTT